MSDIIPLSNNKPGGLDTSGFGVFPQFSNAQNSIGIQEALDKASENGGGIVATSIAGRYYLDRRITIPSNVKWDIQAGVIIDTTLLATPGIVSTSTVSPGLIGLGKVVASFASRPTFNSVYRLECTVLIESADGAAMSFGGSGNTSVPFPSQGLSNVQSVLRLVKPRVLKQFNNLEQVTFFDSGATTSTRVIDPNGPWGRPALKLTLVDAGGTGYTEVRFADCNIENFDDHVVWRVWLDDYTGLSQIIGFLGNDSAYTRNNAYVFGVFNNNVGEFSGARVVTLGPQSVGAVSAGPTFVFGDDPLGATKLRFTMPGGVTTVIWIDAIEVPARQRAIVCLNFDDCDVSLNDQALPIMNANGILGTFGINSGQINGGASFLTSANIASMASYGHQISSHNVDNNKLLTLYSAGRIVGTGTPEDIPAYLTNYRTGQKALEAITGSSLDYCYHPWVQGGFDGVSMEYFRGAGVEIARQVLDQSGTGATGRRGAQPYGSGLSNNVMCLPWIGLGSTITLDAALQNLSDTVKYGSLVLPNVHILAATAANSVTWAISDFTAYCRQLGQYVANNQLDVLTIRELADRLRALQLIDDPIMGYRSGNSVRQIAHLASVNFNSSADQAISLPSGQSWVVTGIIATNVTVNLTTAAGGVYTGAAKGGTAIVAAGQVYTALTGSATQILRLTIAASPTVSNGTIYFSLTTPQGSAATGGLFVFGRPV